MQHEVLETEASSQDDEGNKSAEPKQSNDREHKCENLLELPLELQSKIFIGYLKPRHRFIIRQVNSHIQVLIDDYIGCTVKIDESDDRNKLEFISEVVVRKATINNMTFSKIQETDKASAPIFDDLFLYPQFLQSVLVVNFIDVDFLSDMIRKCKVVESFELGPTSVISNKWRDSSDTEILPEINIQSLDPARQVFFPRCRSLKILLRDENFTKSRERHTQLILKVLKAIRSEYLERVVVQCWSTKKFSGPRISAISAECLERNPSIRSYFVGILSDLSEDEGEEEAEGTSEEDEQLRQLIKTKLIKASRHVRLDKLGLSTTSADFENWKEFLKFQNLIHLSLTVNVEEGVFSAEMFRSCKKTLVQFVLRGKFLTHFDFHWVEECEKLKEICLHNITNEGDLEGPTVQAVNVSLVPVGVESLVLFQTVARTDDVCSALRKLTKLNTLVLFKIGNTAGETGVDPGCLRSILNCRTLDSMLLVRFVADSADAAAEVLKMMQQLKDVRDENNNILVANNNNGGDEPNPDDVPPPLVPIEEPDTVGVEPRVDEKITSGDEKVSDTISPALEVNESKEPGPENGNENIEPIKPPLNLECNHPLPTVQPDEPPESKIEEISPNAGELSTPVPVVNALEGACALISIPVHKMEPHLLTDPLVVPDSKSKHGESEEAAHLYPKHDTESNIPQPKANDKNDEKVEVPGPDNDDKGPPPPPTISEILAIADAEGWQESDFEDYSDTDSDSDYGDSLPENFHDPGFAMGGVGPENNDNVGLDLVGQAENGQNFQLIMDLDNEEDLENMFGLLEVGGGGPQDNNNIAFGFILDGVIDINVPNSRYSRWVAVEDLDGTLTYTLKITID